MAGITGIEALTIAFIFGAIGVCLGLIYLQLSR